AHHLHHLCLEFGVSGKLCFDLCRGFIENFTCGNRVATSLARRRNFEHVGHEFGNPIGTITLAAGTAQLYSLYDSKCSQQHERCGDNTHPGRMPSNILARPIADASSVSRNWTTLQIVL